jgi:hypothetical protein
MRLIPSCARVVALILPAVLLASPAHADPPRLTAGDLRTDALGTPLGIDDTTPTLSWIRWRRPPCESSPVTRTTTSTAASSSWRVTRSDTATPVRRLRVADPGVYGIASRQRYGLIGPVQPIPYGEAVIRT